MSITEEKINELLQFFYTILTLQLLTTTKILKHFGRQESMLTEPWKSRFLVEFTKTYSSSGKRQDGH